MREALEDNHFWSVEEQKLLDKIDKIRDIRLVLFDVRYHPDDDDEE